MSKKLLMLFYRVPAESGEMNSFGQYLFYSVFSEYFEVRGVCFSNRDYVGERITEVNIKHTNFIKIINLVFRLRSTRLTHYFTQKFLKEYIRLINSFNPDYIYVEHALMMQYPLKYRNNAKIIFFDDESSIYIKEKRLRNNLIEKLRNVGLSSFEKKACEISDLILTITDDEEYYLRSIGFENVQNIPYGIDCEYFNPDLDSNNDKFKVLFVGDYRHYPNREAVEIISKEIYPVFINKPEIEFIIAGRYCNKIRNKINQGILVYDSVYDIREIYNKANLFLAPLQSGSGLRIKILEAAASGLPILMTPLANLGIHLIHKKEALISNSIQEMIKYIQNISSNQNEIDLTELATNAREKVKNNFDRKIIIKKIAELADELKMGN